MDLTRMTLEFEFVDDSGGGSFVVTAGNLHQVLASACAGGDIEGAARLYEDQGAGDGDALIAALATASTSTRENAAKMFARARDFGRAARMMASVRDFAQAAGYFEQAGDFAAAAKSHQAAGDPVRAATAYDRAGQVDLAMRLYEAAGARDRVADCLVRHGRALEGADAYRAIGDVRGEVAALRRVSLEDPRRPATVRRLAQILEAHRRIPEATQLLVETLRACPAARDDAELLEQLAGLLERQGKREQARKLRTRVATPAPARPAPAPEAVQDWSGQAGYTSLKAIPIFAELELSDMKDLYRAAEERRFGAGEVIVEEGIEAPGLFVLLEGAAAVLSGRGPSATRLNALGAGDYLGEISLIQGGRTSARVVASAPTRALFVGRERFEHFLYTHPGAAPRIWRIFAVNLAERVRALSAPGPERS